MEVSVSTLYLDIDKAVKENKRYIFLRGSSRSGKTYQTISYIILYALQNPQTTITIVRDTLVSIRNSVLIDFQEVMNQMGLYSPDKFNKSEVIYRFDNVRKRIKEQMRDTSEVSEILDIILEYL